MGLPTTPGDLAVLRSDIRDLEEESARFRRALWLVNAAYAFGFGYVVGDRGWHWVMGASLAVPMIGLVGALMRLSLRRCRIDMLQLLLTASERASLAQGFQSSRQSHPTGV